MFSCWIYQEKNNVESGAFRKRRIIRYFFLSPCLELSRWCIDYIGFYIERKILRLNSNRSDPVCFSRIGFGPGFFLTAGSGSTHPWIRHNLDILPWDGQDTGMFGITMPDQNMHSLYIKIGSYFIFLKGFFQNMLHRSTKFAIILILRNFQRKLFPSRPLIGIFGNREIGFDSATMPADQERIFRDLICC